MEKLIPSLLLTVEPLFYNHPEKKSSKSGGTRLGVPDSRIHTGKCEGMMMMTICRARVCPCCNSMLTVGEVSTVIVKEGWSLSLIVIIIIIIYPLTARVVGASQMILQPVFSIFPCSPLPSGTCHSRPVHSLMLSSHLFLCPPCLIFAVFQQGFDCVIISIDLCNTARTASPLPVV